MLYSDADVFVLDFKTQMVEDAHVDVGNPDDGEPCDDIATPTCVEKLELEKQES